MTDRLIAGTLNEEGLATPIQEIQQERQVAISERLEALGMSVRARLDPLNAGGGV